MWGLWSSPLWSIRYQLYMAEFPHSDVLKNHSDISLLELKHQYFSDWLFVERLKGLSSALLPRCFTSSQPKWEAPSIVRTPVLVISPLLLDSYHRISWADSPFASAPPLLFLFDFLPRPFSESLEDKIWLRREKQQALIYLSSEVVLSLFLCLCLHSDNIHLWKANVNHPSKSGR